MDALTRVVNQKYARKQMPQVVFTPKEFNHIHSADVQDPDNAGQYLNDCKIWQHKEKDYIVIENIAIDGEPVITK